MLRLTCLCVHSSLLEEPRLVHKSPGFKDNLSSVIPVQRFKSGNTGLDFKPGLVSYLLENVIAFPRTKEKEMFRL